jgi:tetratricopeptide (TPR) repeat protein
MRRLIVIAVLAVSLRANADAKTEARTHVEKATELHKANKFAEALEELKTAYALDPQPQLLFAMGQLNVALGRCPDAIPFYERYLASHPDADAANATREAIEVCHRDPPGPMTAPVAPPPEAARPVPPPPPPPAHDERPWYGDKLADGLVIGGVVSGVIGLVMYRKATAALDDAGHAADYTASSRLVDEAHRDRTYAVVFGVAGAALVAAGAAHYMWTREVAVAPVPGGATVSVAGRF